jgi:hypothetical protein
MVKSPDRGGGYYCGNGALGEVADDEAWCPGCDPSPSGDDLRDPSV